MKLAEQLTEMRGQSVEDLQKRVEALEDQIFRLRIQQSMGQTESGSRRGPLRKEIARIQTVLREKQRKG